MRWVREKGLHFLRFPNLAALAGFSHAVFLRTAAMDGGNTAEFNIGLGCGTHEAEVRRNRRRMLSLINGDPAGVRGVYARQVHGRRVAVWAPGDSVEAEETVRLEGDALITAAPGALLVIQVADCQPVIVIDPVRRVIANIHSGWRGSIENIIGTTVGEMARRFGCRPGDLFCGIGPSLGPCCAEFVNYRDEIPEPFWRYRRPGDHFDFWRISVDQLRDAGLHREHIAVSGICTKCNPHLFFSYRKERNTGRLASVVGIHPDRGSI
jgi:YfiH family protein